MTIDELNAIEDDKLGSKVEDILDSLIEVDSEKEGKIDQWIKEYNMEHEILLRQDKIVGKEGAKKTVVVAKLAIPYQEKIVNTATAFIYGSPVKLSQNDSDEKAKKLFKTFEKAYKDAKYNFYNNEIARTLFIETKVAELIYVRGTIELDDEGKPKEDSTLEKKIKVIVLSKKNGDEIYPVFDETNDMVAFIRKYKKDIVVQEEKKEVEVVEIYTAEQNYTCIKDGDWECVRYKNIYGKIPVVYYTQEKAEWANIQSLIDRIEMLISKNADTNDYFGAPAIVAKGELVDAPDKDEVGKFFEIKPTTDEGKIAFGDLEYLTWDMAPEAIKMEYEMLKELVYSQTSTPDLSFSQLQGIGNLSGIAIKLMFLDAIMKSSTKKEVFGIALDRRNNIIQTMLSKIDVSGNAGIEELDIQNTFTSVLPENTIEVVDMLIAATAGEPIMSQETAVSLNPLVENSEQEIKNLEQQTAKQQQLPGSF